MDNICNFCSKKFTTKTNLTKHQTTTKNCLLIQGKIETDVECPTCKKKLVSQYFKQHKLKCDLEYQEYLQKNEIIERYKVLEQKNKEIEKEIDKLKIELAEARATINLLDRQNERLHSSSTNITLKLVEKANTVNNTNHTNTVVINTNQLTNDVLRQCANTFHIDHAHSINGIAKHLTSSLEEHIICTDPSRNIFKYTNEKDEEIIDQNLEILLPQYLTAVKDRNDFLYKEVFEYFKKNNVSLNVQTDYRIFYNALNSIIEKNGQQNKYTEKCKQQMVRECKRRFLDKNKNKDKNIARKLTVDEVMLNIIETGGSLNDFVNRLFPDYADNEEETDEQFTYRRDMEDLFRNKKREWKLEQEKLNMAACTID